MSTAPTSVLVIGFGNPGRLDDGLGPEAAEVLEKKGIDGVTVDANYQLSVEDAEALTHYDVVVFIDASVRCTEPFDFYRITPKDPNISFSSHFIEPQDVLGLAHTMFAAKTRGYILEIRGYEFDQFGEHLSRQAQENLKGALTFIEEKLIKKDI